MAALPVLTAEQITAALDGALIEFDVPELGGSLKLKAFSIDERDLIMSASKEKDGDKVNGNKMVRLMVVHGVVEPKLTTELVGRMDYRLVDKIATKLLDINGMNQKGASADTVADVTFRPES